MSLRRSGEPPTLSFSPPRGKQRQRLPQKRGWRTSISPHHHSPSIPSTLVEPTVPLTILIQIACSSHTSPIIHTSTSTCPPCTEARLALPHDCQQLIHSATVGTRGSTARPRTGAISPATLSNTLGPDTHAWWMRKYPWEKKGWER